MKTHRKFKEDYTYNWQEDEHVSPYFPTEKATFRKEHFKAFRIISHEALQMRKESDFENTLRLDLDAYVAKRLLERVIVEWPSDWWEAFKERWFPTWALRMWPVKYETRAIEAYEYLDRKFLSDVEDSQLAIEIIKPKT